MKHRVAALLWLLLLGGCAMTYERPFDLTLFDAQGQPVWTHACSDGAGRFEWTVPSMAANTITMPRRVLRLVTEHADARSAHAPPPVT